MIEEMIRQLDQGLLMLQSVVIGVEPEEARWKPESGDWSILEIVNHLADEEVEDFSVRFQLTIEEPQTDWPPIDPEGVAVARKYNEQDWDESIERFIQARKKNLAWLRSMDAGSVNLSASRTHPVAGTLHAGDLLASWAAHDLLHLRQIVKRRFQYLNKRATPYRTEYAGLW